MIKINHGCFIFRQYKLVYLSITILKQTTLKKPILLITLLLPALLYTCSSENGESQKTDSIETQIKDSSINIVDDKTSIEPYDNQKVKKLLNEDEKSVFSFKTKKGKTVNIVLQKDNKYMAYRFGTESNVELQFPEKLENTFEQFTYSYYFRGGGAMNMGLDLNYLSFKGDTHKFVVFEEWSAGEDENDEGSSSIGIKIIDLSTKKEVVIEGISSTVKGTLIDFRDNGLVKVEEEEM